MAAKLESNVWKATADPLTAGLDATVGERCTYLGTLYVKVGAASTAWEIATAVFQAEVGGGGGVADGDKGDIVVSGVGTVWTIDPGVLTAAGRSIIDDADAAAQRTTLGLGTAATQATGAFDAAGVAATGDAAHVAAADPHPQYLTAAEGNAAYAPLGTSLTLIEVEKDLGSAPIYSGTFDITGLAGLTSLKQVLITQKAAAYTGKGTLLDESEMDQISINAYVLTAASIRAHWTVPMSNGPVAGNFKFGYTVSG